jgi:hypothetical protein
MANPKTTDDNGCTPPPLCSTVRLRILYGMGSLRSTVAAPHSFYRYQYRYGIVVVVVRGRGWNSDTHILFSFTVIRC